MTDLLALASRVELRAADGRFVSRFCPDPNCGGVLVADVEERWLGGPAKPILRCDGLTSIDDTSPLFACPYSIDAASLRARHSMEAGG